MQHKKIFDATTRLIRCVNFSNNTRKVLFEKLVPHNNKTLTTLQKLI
jgi:hypothetical protein